MRENMKSILYSVCVGTLALALTAGGAQAATDKDKRAQRAKPQQRSANVQAARPTTAARPASAMPATVRAQRNVLAAQNRQRLYATPRTSSAVNPAAAGQASATRAKAARPASTTPATVRGRRDVAVNRDRNVATNRASNAEVRTRNNAAVNRDRNLAANRMKNVGVNGNRNAEQFRARNNVAVNRDRNVAINRTRNSDVNRNAEQFRARNNVALNRNRNLGVKQRSNFAYYRGGNARINNDFHSAAFRGQRYSVFRNYNRQWHDRSWWRSHYTRIIFVNSGWWYWNAGYWFPAWGFAPYVSFVFDGPIYGYNGLSPDQVTVNVQEQLATAGYYDGPIDGVLGPMTREAIAAYQADNGLAITSAIDEPTLTTMGLV